MFTWTDENGKVWYRKGSCTHCGGCCTVQCPYFYFVVNVDLKKGDIITGKDIGKGLKLESRCKLMEASDEKTEIKVRGVHCTPKARLNFPSSPLWTPKYCGYYWVDEEGNRWQG